MLKKKKVNTKVYKYSLFQNENLLSPDLDLPYWCVSSTVKDLLKSGFKSISIETLHIYCYLNSIS